MRTLDILELGIIRMGWRRGPRRYHQVLPQPTRHPCPALALLPQSRPGVVVGGRERRRVWSNEAANLTLILPKIPAFRQNAWRFAFASFPPASEKLIFPLNSNCFKKRRRGPRRRSTQLFSPGQTPTFSWFVLRSHGCNLGPTSCVMFSRY